MNDEMEQDQSIEQCGGTGELEESLESGAQDEGVFVAEEKKPLSRGTVAIFALLVVGIGGIYLMRMKSGPSEAGAAETKTAAATINSFLTDGGKSIRSMHELVRNTEKLVLQFQAFPSAAQVPLAELKTNPFRFLPPKADGPSEAELAAKLQLEKDKKLVEDAIRKLKVQSVMCGSSNSCIINGQMLTEGQQIDNLTVQRILPNAVIIKGGSWTYKLEISR